MSTLLRSALGVAVLSAILMSMTPQMARADDEVQQVASRLLVATEDLQPEYGHDPFQMGD